MFYRLSLTTISSVIVCFLFFMPHMLDAQLKVHETNKFIENQLNQVVKIKLDEVECRNLLRAIRTQHQITVRIHQTAKDAGLADDDLVTFEYHGVSLHSALTDFLKQYSCAYMIKDGWLTFVSVEELKEVQQMRAYDCRELIDLLEKKELPAANRIIEAVKELTDKKMWKESGGRGTIVEMNGVLFIKNSAYAHFQIAKVIDFITVELKHSAATATSQKSR